MLLCAGWVVLLVCVGVVSCWPVRVRAGDGGHSAAKPTVLPLMYLVLPAALVDMLLIMLPLLLMVFYFHCAALSTLWYHSLIQCNTIILSKIV